MRARSAETQEMGGNYIHLAIFEGVRDENPMLPEARDETPFLHVTITSSDDMHMVDPNEMKLRVLDHRGQLIELESHDAASHAIIDGNWVSKYHITAKAATEICRAMVEFRGMKTEFQFPPLLEV